jgi:hypothetical protein
MVMMTMTDATMANLARTLAQTLMAYARDRRPDDQKEIARLHHLLCVEFRNEVAALKEEPPNADPV